MTSNYLMGHEAERYAAQYLEERGFKVREINWRTPICEIDIIAERKKEIYFVEVKYRSTYSQGTGLEYINKKKLQQMQFAAEVWVQEYKWKHGYTLSAIELTGADFEVLNFIESIV